MIISTPKSDRWLSFLVKEATALEFTSVVRLAAEGPNSLAERSGTSSMGRFAQNPARGSPPD
jgi:hypothetical protein